MDPTKDDRAAQTTISLGKLVFDKSIIMMLDAEDEMTFTVSEKDDANTVKIVGVGLNSL